MLWPASPVGAAVLIPPPATRRQGAYMTQTTNPAAPITHGPLKRTKVRNPLIVFALVIPTLGIYYLVWYYKINRERRDLGRASAQQERLGEHPGTSLMAITLGWLLVIPPFVSMYRTFRRIAAAPRDPRRPGARKPVARPRVVLRRPALLLPVEMIYAQNELNRAWR